MGRLIVADGDVDTAQIAEWEGTRRETIRRGLVIGGVSVVAATAIPTLLRVSNAFAQADGDAAILASAVGLEQVAVFAYQTAAESGLLDRQAQRIVERFRGHEQEHAEALTTALTELGGAAPAKPAGVADVDKVLPGLGAVASAQDILMFAIELETAAVAAYYEAHQKLQAAKLLQMGASIMANEGQHLVVLRQAAGQPPVPNAFETGQK